MSTTQQYYKETSELLHKLNPIRIGKLAFLVSLTHLSAVRPELSPFGEVMTSTAVVTASESLASPLFCERQ